MSAVELGLFAELAKAGPLDGEALRDRLGLHPRSARDFFDALVALGMLEREGGLYANTPAGELFLDPAKPSYVGGLFEMANARLYPFWGSLTEALRTGEPQNEAKSGEDFFATIYADPARLAQFAGAMSSISAGAAQAIAAKFPWRDHSTVIDIGCAAGAVPVAIALAHEHVSGGGFDLPALEPIFDDTRERFRPRRTPALLRRRFLRRSAAERGRARDGAHPPRLGPRAEDDAAAEGARGAARRRGADRLRRDSSTTTAAPTRSAS